MNWKCKQQQNNGRTLSMPSCRGDIKRTMRHTIRAMQGNYMLLEEMLSGMRLKRNYLSLSRTSQTRRKLIRSWSKPMKSLKFWETNDSLSCIVVNGSNGRLNWMHKDSPSSKIDSEHVTTIDSFYYYCNWNNLNWKFYNSPLSFTLSVVLDFSFSFNFLLTRPFCNFKNEKDRTILIKS